MSFDFNIFTEAVTSQVERQSLKHGDVLFEIGQPADMFFFCEEGCIRMELFPEENKPIVFYRAREGMAFAEEHIALEKYTYRGVADEDSTIQSVDRRLILNDLRSDPIIAQRFVYCLAKRNFQLRANFERLAIKSAKERVFHLLKTLTAQNHEPLELSGRVKSYSDDLNLTHEAMYRALKQLEDEGRIKRDNGKIQIVLSGTPSSSSEHEPN